MPVNAVEVTKTGITGFLRWNTGSIPNIKDTPIIIVRHFI